MQQEQIKTLLVNVLTAAVVGGVLAVGYFVFIKKDTAVTSTGASAPSVATIAEETTFIGAEIDSSVQDLKGLERAVASSTVIFDLPAFKNLQDFSVAIPAEAIGRPNPFIPAAWKLKLKTLEETIKSSVAGAGGNAPSQASQQSATVPALPLPASSGI